MFAESLIEAVENEQDDFYSKEVHVSFLLKKSEDK